MDFNTARRRKWSVKLFMTKSLESHSIVTLQTLSKHIKARKKELKEGESLRRPLTPLLPWVIDIAFQDFRDAFSRLNVDLISIHVKERT